MRSEACFALVTRGPFFGGRLWKVSAVAVLLCLVFAADLGAQQVETSNPLADTPKIFVRNEWQIWTSPFRPRSYNSRALKKYVIPFAILSGVLIATDRHTGDLLPNSTNQTVWSGRVSQFGAWYSVAGVSGGAYLLGRFAGDNHAREAGLLSLEALGHTQIAVFALKQMTNRERPLEHDGGGGFWEGGTSFPSGHAASVFSLATVFSYEYRDHPAVPIAAYSAAAVISASRLSARRHWVSDIAVGGALGFLIGRFTYRRNHDPSLPGTVVSRSDRLIPQVGFGGSALQLSWHF